MGVVEPTGTGGRHFDHLREHSIGLPQVLFQSITHMAPAAAVAYSIYISVPDARQALPLSVGLALIACICAAIVTSREIYQKVFSRMDRCVVHSTTFGRNNLAMACGLATLEVIEDEGLIDAVSARFDNLWRGQPCASCGLLELCPDPISSYHRLRPTPIR